MSVLASGEQFHLEHEGWQATITEVGATLRRLSHRGRDLIVPFAEDAVPVGSQGQQLMPWPNRIRDGRYTFNGTHYQLPVNEIDRNNALHGLVCWQPWHTTSADSTHVSQRLVVHPQQGWPAVVECAVTHRLTVEGLKVEVNAACIGDSAAPFGYAAHPYLRVDDAALDEWTVQAPFTRRVEVDERLLPVAIRDVIDTPFDLRESQLFGDREFDTAFSDPTFEGSNWQVRLSHGGAHTQLWADEGLNWLQIYTPGDRMSLAVEPMTCGPDTFNPGPTHGDVVVLEPGESVSYRWGITGS